MDATQVALRFNECINARDIDALADLMTGDHSFIDSVGNVESGKDACLDAWYGFFEAFPDYQNHLIEMTVSGDVVTILGHSTCSDQRLEGPAIWAAWVIGEQIAEWRIYDDTPENRHHLNIGPR